LGATGDEKLVRLEVLNRTPAERDPKNKHSWLHSIPLPLLDQQSYPPLKGAGAWYPFDMKNKLTWITFIIVVIGSTLALIGNMESANFFVPAADIKNNPVTTSKPSPVKTPVSAPVKSTPVSASFKSYTDPNLKVAVSYPSDWNYSVGEQLYPRSFWVWKQQNSETLNIVRFAQTDACKPDKTIMISGERAYDTGWQSLTHPTRTVCLIDKKYLITFTASDAATKEQEDAVLASVTIL
jgi:hypothetical protein